MRVLTGSEEIEAPLRRPVVTVGNFDGLHVGHRAILDTVVGRARDLGGEAVVYTFDPHPRKVLRPQAAPGVLTTLEQKAELLEQAGVDVLIVERFTPEFAKTPPESFIRDILWGRIRPVELYVGYDFHFGRDRTGSMRMLTERGPVLGFAVTIIPEVTVGSNDVNSSRIREVLAEGLVEEAATLLGRPYGVRGEVVEGDRRGRVLGFPTANLELDNQSQVLPAAGVYAGRARFLDEGDPARGAELPCVTNVGTRPTFTEAARLVVEAHLLDFDGDLYARRLELAFLERLRPERRFESADLLRRQIRNDVAEGRRRLGGL